jgi:hypothetical protein
MTPAFWILVAAFTAMRSAARAARAGLGRWGAAIAGALRRRRRAKVMIVADEYLNEYTGLTRAELDQIFRDPVWSKRSAGLDAAARAAKASLDRAIERAAHYPL